MNADDRKLVTLIRKQLRPPSPPLSSVNLWSRFERRLDERRTSVGRLEWLMAALVLGLLAAFPEAVVIVLYHL